VRELYGTMINKKVGFTIARRRTIVEHGNPDGTLVLLLKGLKHVKVFNPSRKNIASA